MFPASRVTGLQRRRTKRVIDLYVAVHVDVASDGASLAADISTRHRRRPFHGTQNLDCQHDHCVSSNDFRSFIRGVE